MNPWLMQWLDEEDAAFQLEYGDLIENEPQKPCGWADRVTLFCTGDDKDSAAVLAHICTCQVCEAMYEIYSAAKLYPYRRIGERGGLPLYTMSQKLKLGGENPGSGIFDGLPMAMGSAGYVTHTVPLLENKDGQIIFQYNRQKNTVQILTAPTPVPLEAELYKGSFCLSQQRFLPGGPPFPSLKLRPGATSIAICYNDEFWIRFPLT